MKLKLKLLNTLAILAFSVFSVSQLSAQCTFECSDEAEYYIEILTLLPFDSKAQTVTVGIQEGLVYYQGDIILGYVDEIMDLQNDVLNGIVTSNQSKLWQNSEIPFEINANFSTEEIDKISAAAAYINENTNLCVMPRIDQTDYVVFTPSSGCASFVGRRGGPQQISLSARCSFGSTVHELLHAAGIYHEQSRDDRDDYIVINWDNILEDKKSNFEKRSGSTDFGPYDFGSIMHYPTWAFAINNQIPVITTIPPGIPIGQRSALSPGDIATLNYLYPETCVEIQKPDLAISFCDSINVLNNTVNIHNLTVENIGNAEAEISSLVCYFSEDDIVDAADFKLAELQVPVLLPDGIFTGGLTINLSEIDPPIPAGSYNMLFYTNDGITQPEEDSNILQEADTENNTCSHSSLPKFNITYACKDETAHNYNPAATYENNTTCQTCTDGIKNGDEQDVDCGGSCETTCPCDTHIGTFFFQDCGGILYYFIETDDGHIYDPYFPIDLPVSVTEGLRVQFNYMDNLEVSTPCDVSEKPITITCLQILEDTTPPEITCPSEINNNICAPIAEPSPLTLRDFNATDNITHADSLVFDVEQEIDHQTNFTTYTYLYSISDEAGNTSNCEVVYNIATEFMQAPDINQPSAICENEVWDQIKVGINKYRIYKDENNNPGALLSICDSPVLTCATTDLGVNTAEAGIYYFWITQFIEFLDGEICESASTPFSFTVHANPIATLTEIDKTIQTGEVLFLMDLVEDNKSGYWKGQNVLHVTDNNGNKVPYFTTNMPGVTKLNYIVNNSNCTQSYSLILTIQDNNKMLNPDTKSNLNEFKVYPNPTKGKVNVEWSKNNSLQEIIIYKINGQVIQQFDVPENGTNNIKLDLSQLSNGIYMIEIKSLYLSSMQKLLIE